jgi:hypothetical protein
MTQNAEIKEKYKERYFCDHYSQDLSTQWYLYSGALILFKALLKTGVYLIPLKEKQINTNLMFM